MTSQKNRASAIRARKGKTARARSFSTGATLTGHHGAIVGAPARTRAPQEAELPTPWLADKRTGFLVSAFGSSSALAAILGVSRSQPGKWSKGEETPSPESARLLLDLDHVMARAALIWPMSVAQEWMVGSNSYLEGARPVDVLKTRGSTEVIEALDAAMAGSFS